MRIYKRRITRKLFGFIPIPQTQIVIDNSTVGLQINGFDSVLIKGDIKGFKTEIIGNSNGGFAAHRFQKGDKGRWI